MPEAAQAAEDGVGSRAVLFWLGGQCCAVPADRVVRMLPAQQSTFLPFLPAEVSGVIAVGGKLVPVVELRRLLALPQGDYAGGELLLVAIGAESYALRVDRVLQIAGFAWTGAELWRDTPVRLIDIDDLLERRLRGGTAAAWTSLEVAPSAPIASEQARTRGIEGAALAVETKSSRELLRLDVVVEFCETLPIAAVPDSAPIFAGAAFYRGGLVPVVLLDALLGRAPTTEDAWGALVIVDVDSRRCALAVERVVGLSPAHHGVVQLQALLAKLPPEPESDALTMRQAAPAVVAEARYLLVELAGRKCGFALASVAHIHAACHVAKAPAASRSRAVGVTAIGGRVLPILDLGGLLGLGAGPATQQFVELKLEQTGPFVVAVDRVVGTLAIAQDALIPPPDDTAITAIARLGSDLIWIMDASLIARRGGWRSDAA